MSALAIVEAFRDLPYPRKSAGRRHDQALYGSSTTQS